MDFNIFEKNELNLENQRVRTQTDIMHSFLSVLKLVIPARIAFFNYVVDSVDQFRDLPDDQKQELPLIIDYLDLYKEIKIKSMVYKNFTNRYDIKVYLTDCRNLAEKEYIDKDYYQSIVEMFNARILIEDVRGYIINSSENEDKQRNILRIYLDWRLIFSGLSALSSNRVLSSTEFYIVNDFLKTAAQIIAKESMAYPKVLEKYTVLFDKISNLFENTPIKEDFLSEHVYQDFIWGIVRMVYLKIATSPEDIKAYLQIQGIFKNKPDLLAKYSSKINRAIEKFTNEEDNYPDIKATIANRSISYKYYR